MMFCQNCGKEIADNSLFCNACGCKQDRVVTVNDDPMQSKNSTETNAPEVTLPTRHMAWPLKVLINVLVLILKLALFLVGAAVGVLAIIVSLLGPLAGGALSIMGTIVLLFSIFDKDTEAIVYVTSCVVIVIGGILTAVPSLLATVSGAIQGLSASITFRT